jgi:hypothetical protein
LQSLAGQADQVCRICLHSTVHKRPDFHFIFAGNGGGLNREILAATLEFGTSFNPVPLMSLCVRSENWDRGGHPGRERSMNRTIARFWLEAPDRMSSPRMAAWDSQPAKATCKSVNFDPVFPDIFRPAVDRFENMRPIGDLQAATSGGPASVNSHAAGARPAAAARPRTGRHPHSPFIPAALPARIADGLAATTKPSTPLPGRNVVSCY